MVHGLHGDGFSPVQGSVDIRVLEGVVDKMGNNLTYTFDDRLESQELAVNLLNRKGIRGVFFVNSHNEMEQDRMIRERPDFYNWFMDQYGKPPKMPNDFLIQFSFYSFQDRMYRYIRDIHDPKGHDKIMRPHRKEIKLLDLDKLKGHELGLHSYSHPRRMEQLSYDEQYMEYKLNLDLVPDATSMAHPMGSYNNDTIKVLRRLGIKKGYKASDSFAANEFDLPRVDITLWK